MDIKDLESYCESALTSLNATSNFEAIEEWHRQNFAKMGVLSQAKKGLGKIQNEDERKAFGKRINEISFKLESAFKVQQDVIRNREILAEIMKQRTDVTLPSRKKNAGSYHPVTQMLREIYSVFAGMGFMVFDAPHVELDLYNFQLLNIPPDHPARDMQDTFYVSDDVVLRTHTSPGQIRAMEKFAPNPIQVILPGLCYRYETITTRSEVQFHQVEGLLVSEHVRMSDLKGILVRFARMVFGDDQEIRFRGSYFPFTEPSVEVDIKCTVCKGSGCRICKHTGWLELLGAGMVHPNVLRNGGYDPQKFRGLAFGMGIERAILLKHQINDIRYFYQDDLRFLHQFK